MGPRRSHLFLGRLVALAWLLSMAFTHAGSVAASPGQNIIPILQAQLGLTEQQVRGALGALLVFVREELPKPAFDELARTIPNAQRIMQEAKSAGHRHTAAG